MIQTKVSKILFYVLVFLLPVNLGLHFVIKDAYVWGLLIDYLVPTVFVQDIGYNHYFDGSMQFLGGMIHLRSFHMDFRL